MKRSKRAKHTRSKRAALTLKQRLWLGRLELAFASYQTAVLNTRPSRMEQADLSPSPLKSGRSPREIFQRTMAWSKKAPKGKPGPVPDDKTCDIVIQCILLERQGYSRSSQPFRDLAHASWGEPTPPDQARKRLTSLIFNAKRSGLWHEMDKYLPRT
jgi:hypothetical protein